MTFDPTRTLNKLLPKQDGPPNLTLRAMVVSAVNSNGTVDLTSSGVTIPSVDTISPSVLTVGTKVQVLTGRGVSLVIGRTGTPGSTAWVPTITGTYWRLPGGIIKATLRIVFGTTGVNAGSGDYRISLPVTPSTSLVGSGALGSGHPIGTATLRNAASVGASTGGIVQLVSTTTALILAPGGGAVGAANPWAWSANSQINVMLDYPTSA